MTDKKLHAIYNMPENEIEEKTEWWKGKQYVAELDRRYKAMESGLDKGYTIEQLEESMNKLRQKRYGK